MDACLAYLESTAELLLLSPLALDDKAAVIIEPGTLNSLPAGADAIETVVEALAMTLASWRWALIVIVGVVMTTGFSPGCAPIKAPCDKSVATFVVAVLTLLEEARLMLENDADETDATHANAACMRSTDRGTVLVATV